MVNSVGYDYKTGDLLWHFSETTEVKNLHIEKVHSSNGYMNFFQELQNHITEQIDYFCVLMQDDVKNNTRKKFIEYAKTQKYITNVRIIGMHQAMLCNAVETLSNFPVQGDSLWVFINYRSLFICVIWDYNEETGWKFQKSCGQLKSLKGVNQPPTLKELKELKMRIHNFLTIPYIFISSGCILNEMEFKSVFSKYKEISCVNALGPTVAALFYAICLSNEVGYSKFKSITILEKYIVVEHNNKKIFYSNRIESLPFSVNFKLAVEESDIIAIYEDSECQRTIKAESAIKCNVTVCIDINGIYTFKAKSNVVDDTLKTNDEFYFIPKPTPTYDSELNAVGIDFGMTECCAAVIRKNGPDFVVLGLTTNRTMPSYVAFDEKQPKCGQIVIDRMKHKCEYSVFDIKRIIGKNYEQISIDPFWPFKIIKQKENVFIEVETFNGKAIKSPEDVSAVLLSRMKVLTEEYQNTKLTDVVITIPAKFSNRQKQSLKSAAVLAGWTKIHFLPEPVAAAFAYFVETNIPNFSNILICDCGGGTVDICVSKLVDDQLQILNIDGDAYLGGRDFDNILFTHFNAVLKHKFGIDVSKNRKKYVLKQKCQDIKHKLSTEEEDWIDVDDFDSNIDEIIKITKIEFEEMSLPLIVKIKDAIHRTLTESNLPKSSINYVFQVGGGCRMPMMKQVLLDIFPDSIHQCSLYPDWIVAHGAALYSYYLQANNNDVTGIPSKKVPLWLLNFFDF